MQSKTCSNPDDVSLYAATPPSMVSIPNPSEYDITRTSLTMTGERTLPYSLTPTLVSLVMVKTLTESIRSPVNWSNA